MKFLLDENVPLSIKKVVKELGYHAITLHDENKLGIKNGEVADLAIKKDAIIITLDSDFLTIKKDLQVKSKIIFVNIHPRNPKVIIDLIKKNPDKCIAQLNIPGKVILTESDIIFESP